MRCEMHNDNEPSTILDCQQQISTNNFQKTKLERMKEKNLRLSPSQQTEANETYLFALVDSNQRYTNQSELKEIHKAMQS